MLSHARTEGELFRSSEESSRRRQRLPPPSSAQGPHPVIPLLSYDVNLQIRSQRQLSDLFLAMHERPRAQSTQR